MKILWLTASATAVMALAACGEIPPVAQVGAGFDVKVERVSLNALQLPGALVTVTNRGDATAGQAMVECRFFGAGGDLIGVGVKPLYDLAPGQPVSGEVMSADQGRAPGAAECRIRSAG